MSSDCVSPVSSLERCLPKMGKTPTAFKKDWDMSVNAEELKAIRSALPILRLSLGGRTEAEGVQAGQLSLFRNSRTVLGLSNKIGRAHV